jgi:protein TonB
MAPIERAALGQTDAIAPSVPKPTIAEPNEPEPASPSVPTVVAVAAPSAVLEAPLAAPRIEPPRFEVAYLDNPPPAYPALARRMKLQGTVVLRVLVNSTGRAEELIVDRSSGTSILDQAALGAVRDWRFVPARRGADVIAHWVDVPVRFRLQD